MINNNHREVPYTSFTSLEDITAHKNEIGSNIAESKKKIVTLWNLLSTPEPTNNRGELISSLINNSITAFDAFMLGWKLTKRFGRIFR